MEESKNRCVLIYNSLEGLREALEDYRYSVGTARSENEFWDLAFSLFPSIFILISRSSPAPCVWLCEQLRTCPLFEEATIFVVAAKQSDELTAEVLDVGANCFVSLPTEIPELLCRVKSI